MKKIVLLFCLASSPVLATDQQININVHGYVAAMPCELETINHVIDLKKVNVWNIRETQASPWVDFSIKLKNCPMGTKEAIMEIKGTPDSTTTDYFINTGSAKNVALNLAHHADKATIKNGEKITVPVNEQTRKVDIPLSARMAGYGSGMTSGSFNSHLDFTFVYH
ncbi:MULTISPECIES: fimbrial protein [Providencia]|uniref:fimbrial protein n=1 Tax=Providencia TaxID=586 RepID=UPI0023498146|nr:fimbrial protein [Providencia sp. PROV143]